MMNRDSIRISLIALVIAVAGFALAYQFVEPSPPNSLTIASGSKSGAYHAFARRYASILAREGITLNVLETGGSVDNIALLADGKADVAFVQGGVGDAAAQPTFEALGSLYFEPLWVFVRAATPIKVLSDLKDRPIAAGGEGSGTWAVARQLLDLNAVASDGPLVRRLSSSDGARALDRKSTRLNSSHITISYAVFCLKKKTIWLFICQQILRYDVKSARVPVLER